jgi:hypothetical protein
MCRSIQNFVSINSRHQELIDGAIREALKSRPVVETSGFANVTPPDHFYRQISKIEDFVEGFQRVEQGSIL